MKTYLRILAYAKPYRRFVPVYLIYAFLSIVFGLLNFTLLKPLFDVIFEQVDPEQLVSFQEKPEFSFSLNYFTHLFNYNFLQIAEEYGRLGTLFYVCIIIVLSVFLSNLFTYLSGVVLAKVRAVVIKKMRMDIITPSSSLRAGRFALSASSEGK